MARGAFMRPRPLIIQCRAWPINPLLARERPCQTTRLGETSGPSKLPGQQQRQRTSERDSDEVESPAPRPRVQITPCQSACLSEVKPHDIEAKHTARWFACVKTRPRNQDGKQHCQPACLTKGRLHGEMHAFLSEPLLSSSK